MSIRLKVTLATVGIAALGIGAAGAATFILLSGYFDTRAAASVRPGCRVKTLSSYSLNLWIMRGIVSV